MRRSARFHLLLVGLAVVLSALLFFPFLQYALSAVLLAYLLYPLQRRLAPHVGSRFSAVVLILLSAVALLVPFAVVVGVAIDQAVDILRSGAVEFDESAVEAGIQSVTGVAVDVPTVVIDPNRIAEELLRQMGGRTTDLLGGLFGVFGGISNALIGVTVFVFLLYYFLADGDRLLRWLGDASPLSRRVREELYAATDRIMWAVLVGNAVVAVVQGVLTGVGLAVVGVSNVVFWTVMTTVLSFLPLIGASIVWVPASIYLLVVGRAGAAALLFVYGSVVVSLSDNYVRPVVSGRGANLNPAIVIVGIFGGLYLFGFVGLFFGPIVLGLLKTLVELYADEYGSIRLSE
ncbi:AI-2E family transporter [Halegenticoccus tardaugens]|uniref:AI-2E family transporter n=1 Tax=Halegenticoccus tardaugens TaxID=2071624 RepID=UPI001E55D1A2|nr:AI-2E family transporter [Halegenticoccus tardaugens]